MSANNGLRLRHISNLDHHGERYVVASDTPDNGWSTYPECWGANAGYRARAVFSSDCLAEAISIADRHSTVMDRNTGMPVGKRKLDPCRDTRSIRWGSVKNTCERQ